MTNDQPKAPMSAEKMLMGRLHVIGNSMQPYVRSWNEILKEKNFVIELMESYAAETCADKQAEIDQRKREYHYLEQDHKWTINAYRELKARADKMLEALVNISEVSAHKPRGSDPWQAFEDCQEIALEAIKNDE